MHDHNEKNSLSPAMEPLLGVEFAKSSGLCISMGLICK
jgi:hypothetical protein